MTLSMQPGPDETNSTLPHCVLRVCAAILSRSAKAHKLISVPRVLAHEMGNSPKAGCDCSSMPIL